MKKSEKRGNMSAESRKAFYCALVSKLDPKMVYEPIDLNDVVSNVVNEQGGSTVHKTFYINNLLKIIGEDAYEMINDSSAKTRGRSAKYIFSLKKSREELYERIDSFFKKPEKEKADELNPATIKPKGEAKEETVAKESHPKKETGSDLTVSSQRRIDRLWKLLTYSIKNKQTKFTYDEIGKITGLPTKPNRKQFEYWISQAKEIGATIEYLYSGIGRGLEIILKNPGNSILSLSEAAKKIGKEYDPTPYLGKKVVKEVAAEKSVKTPQASDFEKLTITQKKQLWHIAGVLREYGNVPLDLAVIGKYLYKEFGIEMSGSQIRTLVMTSPIFIIEKTGMESKIRLAGDTRGDESYEFLKAHISPMCSKQKTLARLGMTLEELREYLPDSKVISEITPNDNIFEVVFDASKKSMLMLSLLVMQRRGTDVFFDKGIVEFAKRRINDVHEKLMKIDSDYRIENL